jgi:O-antigen ligase
MAAIFLYLITLMIAPQLWVPGLVGLPTDYICFPLLVVAAFFSGNIPKMFQMRAPDLLLIGFATWVTLSALVNGLPNTSVTQIIFYWKMVILWKLMTTIIGDVERTRTVTTFFCFIIVVLAIQAIQQKYSATGVGWAGQTPGWIDPAAAAAGDHGRSRWIGIFSGPGVFAVLFSMGIAFPLCHIRPGAPMGRQFMAGLITVVMLWALYCTGSRGGLLAGIAVIGVYVMVRAKITLRTMILVGSGLFLVYNILPSYITTIRDQSNSSQYRVAMWAAALDMIKGNPLFGVGITNFKAYSGRLIGHNSAVEIMAETGLIGLGLWVGLIYACVKGVANFRASAESEDDKWYGLALLLSLIGYLGSAMFVTLEYETIYLLLGWCAVVGYSAPQVATFGGKEFVNVGKICLAWIVVLQAFVMIYLG